MKAIAGPQFSKYANRKHEQVRVTMPSNFSKRDARLRPSAARLPEYYVLLCAHRYAAAVEKLAAAATDDEQRQAKMRLFIVILPAAPSKRMIGN
jgi:hypothetical protein